MSHTNIISEEKNGITTITINRPNKLNALNIETIEALHHAIKEAVTKKWGQQRKYSLHQRKRLV